MRQGLRNRGHRFSGWSFVVAAAAVLFAAGDSRGDNATVNAFSGSFATSVPISVPGFRGLEPQVGLEFSSSSGNGFVGVGWNVSGGSWIDRTTAGRGTPKFDGTDVYRLDGMSLVACGTGVTSPSCTSGGNYAPRVESYSKIIFNSSLNQWTVWTRDGTKSVYTARFTTTAGTLRWALATRSDPRGNTVTYNWYCDQLTIPLPVGPSLTFDRECYLDTITYNGVTVRFWRESRPDVITYATGSSIAGKMQYRLKSVEVRVGSSLARAYQLTYTTASSCGGGQSLLTSVRQFGSNATVSAAGAISGGTALPAATYGWSQPGSLGSQTYLRSQSYEYAGSGGIRRTLADINGDGRTDYCYQRDGYREIRCMLGTATGLGAESLWGTFSYDISNNIWGLADFNGDGKADFFYRRTDYKYLYVSLSTGTAFGTSTYWGAHTYDIGGDYTQWHVIDVNSDGKVDFLYERANVGNPKYYRALLANAGGTGFSSEIALFTQTYDSRGDDENNQQWFADVNGDGCPDRVYQRDGSTELRVLLSNWCTGGTSFGAETVWGSRLLEGSTWAEMTDLNGDGRADHVYQSSADRQLRVMLSTGRAGFLEETTWGTASYNVFEVALRWFTDVDADGLPDFVYQRAGSDTEFRIMKSTGVALKADALFMTRSWDAAGADALNATWFADVTGDGRPDHLYRRVDTKNLYLFASQGSMTTLLTSVGSGLGGTTTLTYAPSSTWVPTYLPAGVVFPTVQAVSISDGRGDAQTTTYAYEGALWLDSSKEFLGFRRATTTQSSTGAYSETYYWQREGTVAKPEVIYKRKADGSILSFEKLYFTEATTAPFTSLATQMWAYECNGNGVVDANNNYVSGCKRVYTGYSWDQYGNMTREDQHGDYDLSGDERTVVRSFAPNTSAYIVGLPAYEEIRAGIGASGTLLSRMRFFYDGASSESTAPSEGKLTKKGFWNSQTGGYVEDAFGYDSYGNQTSVVDRVGKTHSKAYDSTYRMFVTSTTNPLGHVESSTWNTVLGRELTRTDTNGGISSNYYDALGRATLSQAPSGAQVKTEYLSYGTVSSQKNRVSTLLPGSTWVWEDSYFDGLNRTYKVVSSTGVTADTIFGASGKEWKKSLPYVSGEIIRYDVLLYDEVGRTLSQTTPAGALVTSTYDDFYATVKDPLGNVRSTWFDAYGRATKVREVIDGVNRDTSFYYDLLGRRTKSTDALGNQTVVVYDSLGRALQKTDPDKGLWTSAYDAAGRLTRETDALGAATSLAYDSLGRVTKRTYANNTWDRFVFDETGRGASKGRLTTSISACGSANQTTCVVDATASVTTKAYYDSMGRRTKYQQQVGSGTTYSISHTYDVAGRVVTVTYPDGDQVGYAYGTSGWALGRAVSAYSTMTGYSVSNVGYDPRGRVTSVTHGNGVTTATTYDTHGERVTAIQIGALARLNYLYDLNGRITSLSSPQLTLTNWQYRYDTIGRLTSATNTADGTKTQTFRYDALGRMTYNSKVGTYSYADTGHDHAVTQAGSNTYAYNANGDMLTGAGRTLTFNYDHRPSSITAGGLTTSFVYDAQGLRVKKSSGSGTVQYVGGIYELRGSAVTKYYMLGGTRMSKTDANGTAFFHGDNLGSTRLVTNSAGAEVKRYEYAPYGAVLSETGTRPDSHRFTGQESDDETGLVFYQARYYDAVLGRFVQADSFLTAPNSPQALDLYAYANNAPTTYVDPSGHAILAGIAVAWIVANIVVIAKVALIIVGTVLSFSKNPYLQTLGMILGGIGGAFMGPSLLGLSRGVSAAIGGLVGLAQSPLSPLDPTIKKAIGWAYTVYGAISSIADTAANGTNLYSSLAGSFKWTQKSAGQVAAWASKSWGNAILTKTLEEVFVLAGSWAVAYSISFASDNVRMGFAFLARALMFKSATTGGPLTILGASYDMAYTLRYPDGRTIDLSGGEESEVFEFYYHTGFENPLAFGRQHIRVGDKSSGGFWELGDTRAGFFGAGIGWAGWIGTQRVRVIMSTSDARQFREILGAAGEGGGRYQGFHRDSYYYISAALEAVTGKSAADLHINPGLIHW